MAGMLDDDFSSAPLELPEEANKLYRVFRTVNTMLHKRGYIVDEADRNITKDAFSEKYGPNFARDSLSVLGSHPTTASKILVFFPRDEKVGIAPINEIMGKMTDDGIEHAILIVKVAITPHAKKTMVNMDGYHFEHFTDAEMLVDITEHELVPEHVVLSDSEKAELLKRYSMKETQLPRIQQHDPVARFFGMRKGMVVKIIRPSETAGRYVTYRYCI
ncbi:hypothetical protein ScalyP_jg6132 [Parmales sp. scaly parma]|nr:hypothetical protein ScalyP_jg6132 [Parmales sp. scaly parma]